MSSGIWPSLRSFLMRNRRHFGAAFRLRKVALNHVRRWKLRRRYPDLRMVSYTPEQIRSRGGASQLGQDLFIQDHLVPAGYVGTFVDIGCNHPLKNNNSLLLEKAGWIGYAFDPQARFEEDWQTERKTQFFRAAVSDTPGEAEFVEFEVIQGWEHELSGFAVASDPAHLAAMPHRRTSVPAGPLTHFIEDLEQLDLALIDVEGAEMVVLDGLGLEQLRPRWVIIENNRIPAGDDAIRDRLVAAGYHYVARISDTDDVFEQAHEL